MCVHVFYRESTRYVEYLVGTLLWWFGMLLCVVIVLYIMFIEESVHNFNSLVLSSQWEGTRISEGCRETMVCIADSA